MSHSRVSKWGEGWRKPDDRRGPNGRRLCTWCKTEVPKGRRTWCGPACIHQGMLRTDPSYMRAHVAGRDHGVCGKCGLDTEKLERIVTKMRELLGKCNGGLTYSTSVVIADKWINGRHLWEAHHKVAVTEGGGECGLEGMITLCIWCHGEETGALRRRLNAKPDGQQGLDLNR